MVSSGSPRNDATLDPMQRRTLLKLGLAGSAVLALVGGGTALMHEPAWREGRLMTSGRAVFGAVARAVLDGSLPAGGVARAAALGAHLERLEATLRALPPAAQREIASLLAVLASPPGRLAVAGLNADWVRADIASIQVALQSMRHSRLALRQQAYHALRDLTHAAYFADRATWVQLGYPGPTSIA
jgi:hypothetical protein